MSALGGYFGLELRSGNAMHSGAIALNSGRNALEYILRARKYKRLFLPYYTCPAVWQPVNRQGLEVVHYSINDAMDPVFDFEKLGADDGFIYTNYFGLKDACIKDLGSKVPNLIVDNAQAFFARPFGDSFYSPRKFFGVPDGGYAYCASGLDDDFETEYSADISGHLLIREDEDAESGYGAFCEAEMAIEARPIRRMSRLTERILQSIDYEDVADRRRTNFNYIHEALGRDNQLEISISDDAVPMSYPFLSNDQALRSRLISERVFVPQYWPDLKFPEGSFEERLTNQLVPLPIDQRLDRKDLDFILSIIRL